MRERGFALVTVVLLMIGLGVLATGLAFAASQQATVAASHHDLVRARLAADGVLARAIEDWSAARRSLDPLGVPVPLIAGLDLEPGVRVSATVRRLGADTYLVRGLAVVTRGALPPMRRTEARLVRSVDVDSVGAAFDAAVISGAVRVEGGATVAGSVPPSTGPPTGSPHPPSDPDPDASEAATLCAGWPTEGAALRMPPESLFVESGASVTGAPALWAELDPARFRADLGILDLDALRRAARGVGAALVHPQPATIAGACDSTAVGNWGAADGPCAGLMVLRHASGPLRVDGGYGQGILIADGDVRLEGGVRFRGILIAAGTVTLADAAFEGVIVAPRVRLAAGARATLDRCAIAAALRHTAAVDRAYPPPRSRLPTFD